MAPLFHLITGPFFFSALKTNLPKRYEELMNPAIQQKILSDIQAKITEKEVKIKGKDIGKYLPGAQTGAVRTFNLVGDPHIIDAVLRKYDIKFVTRYLNQSELGQESYLSQVQTNKGTFANTARKPGNYDVFSCGPVGTRKLQELEIEALKAAGYNPLKVRLIEIVFGIRLGVDGPDLAVIDIRADKVRF